MTPVDPRPARVDPHRARPVRNVRVTRDGWRDMAWTAPIENGAALREYAHAQDQGRSGWQVFE